MFKKRSKKGFTLIEMMAVVAIIAILVAIVMPIVSDSRYKAACATNAANLRTVEARLKHIRVLNSEAFHTYAATLDQIGEGQISSSIVASLNALVDGLGESLYDNLRAATAENGVLVLTFSPEQVVVDAPQAKKVDIRGENRRLKVDEGTEMTVYITDMDIVAMYGDYSKDDFADYAGDGDYEAEDDRNLVEKVEDALKCENHVPDPNNGCKCPNCYVASHDFERDDYDHVCGNCGLHESHTYGKDSVLGGHTCTECLEPIQCKNLDKDKDGICDLCLKEYGGGCVTPDTLVTLADGSKKRIDEVTYEDELLVWDHYDGTYTTASSALIQNHGYDEYTIITLTFDDGTVVNVVNIHGFFSADSNGWVYINANNAEDYIGTNFVQVNGDSYDTVKLVDCDVKIEETYSYCILAAGYYNCVVEDMFSMAPPVIETNFYIPFEIGEGMKYDEDAMAADIAEYGLYTYEDFAEHLSEDVFYALNIPQLKVSVAKGLITYDQILALIESEMN